MSMSNQVISYVYKKILFSTAKMFWNLQKNIQELHLGLASH